ncbi:MAG: HK97 gp10 family phage protein [Oscillospiraceae bacterium]
MSVDYGDLVTFRNNLQALLDDVPNIMDELVVGEGVYAVKQAVRLCQEKKIDNTSLYKRSFHADEKAHRSGDEYRISFYNNADYAKHIEYGFRSHFVPGHWEGSTFVYAQKDPAGGMYVGPRGGYVPGKFVFRLACRAVATTKDARLRRKLYAALRQRFS